MRLTRTVHQSAIKMRLKGLVGTTVWENLFLVHRHFHDKSNIFRTAVVTVFLGKVASSYRLLEEKRQKYLWLQGQTLVIRNCST